MGVLNKNHVRVTHRNFRSTLGCFLSFFLIALSVAPASSNDANAAEEPRPTEYQVKAAYLYNFGRFVRWPTDAAPAQGAAFNICILGRDPFDGALRAVVAGQTINGHPVTVKEVSDSSGAEGCQIVYVDGTETKRFRSVLNNVRRMPLVTVSDSADFLDRGGIIQFTLINDRVRFAVNLEAAREARLQLSAELLKVAIKVTGGKVEKEQR
ncbi:MAG TPA: YfiR family protein [Terriglobales bacterium]|nr:YfiR family protein [Terriglobales bacterium]